MPDKQFSFKKLLNNNGSSIKEILSRSTKAVCGTFEKEVVVRKERVGEVKNILKARGFVIIGTGPAGPNSTKIWFNPAGAIL